MAYSDAQTKEYNAYLSFLRTPEGQGFPVPRDIRDYFAHLDEWMGQVAPAPSPEWTTPQRSAYERYQMYGDLYGEPDDWYARDIKDFFDNYDVAGEQLDEWTNEASRDYRDYLDLGSWRKPGEWYAVDLDDFVANYDQSQGQQDSWKGMEMADIARAGRAQAAQTTYRPEVRYDPAFYKGQEALKGESVYYQGWMRAMFPELQRRFEASRRVPGRYSTMPGAEAAGREIEQEWGQYLDVQKPKLKQEFYGQRPTARGERPQYYQSRIRQVSY